MVPFDFIYFRYRAKVSEACATPLWMFTRLLNQTPARPKKQKQKQKALAKSQKPKAKPSERSLLILMNTTVMMSNITAINSNGKQCDCCLNNISDDSDHVQNFPCGHKICFFCFVTSTMKRANPACCQVKDCPQKYTASCQYFNRGNPGKIIENEVVWSEQCCNILTPADTLSTDDLATIFGFLHIQDIMLRKRGVCKTWRVAAKKAKVPFDNAIIIDKVCTNSGMLAKVFAYLVPEEIMSLRRVCKLWREAAKMTIVSPNTIFSVDTLEKYNVMNVMTRALPNLQGLSLKCLGDGDKYSEGEDPVQAYRTANWRTHHIGMISNFSKLRELKLESIFLNGRYPFLFNSFPLLQILSIHDCKYLKLDLEMLAGFPALKELSCYKSSYLTGNINSLRVLKDTLERVSITRSYFPGIEGNFMDLADFPHLKELNLEFTAVKGDIQDIGENHFPSLECLNLPKGVYGGNGYEFQRISDGPVVMRAVYLLKKQRPALDTMGYWHATLSGDSPDWYYIEYVKHSPPFTIYLVEAGSRIGYRWGSTFGSSCEVNWLDPEPDRESIDYEEYIMQLGYVQEIKLKSREVDFYKGFYHPPTEEEYRRLWEQHISSRRLWEQHMM